MSNRKTSFILAAILIVVAVLQSQNMFQFPYYHDDEGTHLANSWAVATEGQLSPYTYSYEDPPVGSLVLALWTRLTGGPSAFGFSVNSGRVLMLILHLITTALIYLLTRKIAKSDFAAVIATLVFAFSPLATSLQRLVLLENIMIVWLLAALFFAVGEKRTLIQYFASAFLAGLAVLTKGSAIFFIPALFVIILASSDKHHRRFAVTLWATMAIGLISFYPLYAQMKEELFPEGAFLGGDFPHVSLLERLGDRGPDTGRFLNYASNLGPTFREWVDLSSPSADPVLIYAGLISAVFVLLLSIDNRDYRPLVIMLLAEGAYLLFGGPVYNIDVILLLPFLAISVGLLVGKIAEALAQNTPGYFLKYALALGALVIMLYPFWSFNSSRLDVFTVNQVDGQIAAAEWVSDNLPEDAVVVTDNYAFIDLRETHPNTHSYWRIDTDPAVKFELLKDDTCNIDYVITTPQIISDINTFKLDLMRRTIENSEVLMSYTNNGWPVEIRQVQKTYCAPQLVRDENTSR